MTIDAQRKRKFSQIILAYPIVLVLVGLLANFWVFGVAPTVIALPQLGMITSLVVSAILLLANHTWLMTSTELTRLKYDMHATPEERETSGHAKADVPIEGVNALERHHNAHANSTENMVHFVFLALLISVISPITMAASVWIIGFAIGRLGHTFSYLTGRDGLRGICMSVSLVSLYGMASYLVVSLIV